MEGTDKMEATSREHAELARQHGRMLEVAVLKREHARAMAVVDRAFAELAELDKPVRRDDPLTVILSIRIANILAGNGIQTIGQLCEYTRDSLASVNQIRYRSIDVIERSLRQHGFRLKRNDC